MVERERPMLDYASPHRERRRRKPWWYELAVLAGVLIAICIVLPWTIAILFDALGRW